MSDLNKPVFQRIASLIRVVRQLGALLPGEKVKIAGERPATYLGAIEEGDIQVDYVQLHAFRLHDGVWVVLESPSLNRKLGKWVY